jgi:hypothetical protein
MSVVVVPPEESGDVVVVPPVSGGGVVVSGGKYHVHSEYLIGLGVRYVQKITKAQHDALNPPDPATLYLIVLP